MYSNSCFGFTIVIALLLNLYLTDCTKGYVLVICNLHFFSNLNVSVDSFHKQLANYSKIIMITLLKMDFRALANSTLECPVNFFKDGNVCKGIALL